MRIIIFLASFVLSSLLPCHYHSALASEPVVVSDEISTDNFQRQYEAFRKQYRIPSLKLRDEVMKNYLDHYVVDEKIKKDKDLKIHAIQLLEAEKSLYASYQEFYKERIQFKVEKALLNKAGIAMERKMKRQVADALDGQLELLGQRFSKLLKTSLVKLYDAFPHSDSRDDIFMASGGRYIPDVTADDDYFQFMKYSNAKTIEAAKRSISSELKEVNKSKPILSSAKGLHEKLKGHLSDEELKVVHEQLAVIEKKNATPEELNQALEKLEDKDLISYSDLKD